MEKRVEFGKTCLKKRKGQELSKRASISEKRNNSKNNSYFLEYLK